MDWGAAPYFAVNAVTKLLATSLSRSLGRGGLTKEEYKARKAELKLGDGFYTPHAHFKRGYKSSEGEPVDSGKAVIALDGCGGFAELYGQRLKGRERQLGINMVNRSVSGTGGHVLFDIPEGLDRQQAQAYNAVLAGQTPAIDPNTILPYERQLTFDRDPMMSWIEIPSIDVSMPIYHGTSDSALMAGVGHLEGTSLPVGGASTHCVLTAHSGMKNLSMFDDIRDLRPGDIVLLHTLGKTLAYKMVSSEVVWPDNMKSLGIEQGADKVTLVTCTPYGINDHRLLVHCVRTKYDPKKAAAQRSLSGRHWGRREIAVALVAGTLALVGVDVVVHRVRKRRKAVRKAAVASASAGGGGA